MSDARDHAALRELAARLERQGYGVRRVAFFSEAGIMVFRRAKAAGPSGGSVLEGCVFLDRAGHGWHARVTQHGGRKWLKAAHDVTALEDAALEGLHATHRPPSDGWVAVY